MSWVGPDPWQAPGSAEGGDFLPPTSGPTGSAFAVVAAGALVRVASVALPLVLLGAPAGLLWARLGPGITVAKSGDSLDFPSAETKESLSVDLSFLLITVLVGVACGLVVWQLHRRRGLAVPVGLAAGSLLASVIARTVGQRVVVNGAVWKVCAHRVSLGCTYFDGHPHLRAGGLVVGWPVAALLTVLILAAVFDRDPEPEAPALDWGYYAPPEPYRPVL